MFIDISGAPQIPGVFCDFMFASIEIIIVAINLRRSMELPGSHVYYVKILCLLSSQMYPKVSDVPRKSNFHEIPGPGVPSV